MSEEIDLLKVVAARLASAGIQYMMTGSMAQALYATPRMTRDIDIVVQLYPTDIHKITVLFQDDFYIDEESIRQAVAGEGIFNIIHNPTVIKIDFIVRKKDEYRVKEFSRRQTIDVEGTPVTVVAPEDLILSKLVWAKLSQSELQCRDVRQMMLTAKNLDTAYLEKWSLKLGVDDLLHKVMQNA
jgi:hypothetical protein